MMIMEQALYDLIAAIPGLNIGAGTEEDPIRIYHTVAPEKSPDPYVILQRVDSDRWRAINNPSGMVQATIQIDSYAQEKWDSKTLAGKIEKALDGYKGDVTISGTSPILVCKFAGISCENDVDLFDKTDEPFLFRVSSDYLVTYEQT